MDYDIRLDARLLPERHERLVLDLHFHLPAYLHHLDRGIRMEKESQSG
jgi:hypothetical protein